MWPHLYTPTGLRVGAPQTRNIEYLGYLRSKSYEKRLKTIVIDRPTKKRFGGQIVNFCYELRFPSYSVFKRYERYESIFTQNDVFRKLCVMKLRSWWHLNGHCTTIFHRVMAVFVFLTSEIPILEQKYNINGRTVLIQSCYLDFLVFQGPYFVIHYFRNGSSHFERMTRTLRNACIGQQISVSSVDALIGTWMRTIHCLL